MWPIWRIGSHDAQKTMACRFVCENDEYDSSCCPLIESKQKTLYFWKLILCCTGEWWYRKVARWGKWTSSTQNKQTKKTWGTSSFVGWNDGVVNLMVIISIGIFSVYGVCCVCVCDLHLCFPSEVHGIQKYWFEKRINSKSFHSNICIRRYCVGRGVYAVKCHNIINFLINNFYIFIMPYNNIYIL